MRPKIILSVLVLSAGISVLPRSSSGKDFSPGEHWKRPAEAGAQKAGLPAHPEKCGECHKRQYDGWKGSLHSRAAGPGLLAQLNPLKKPSDALTCYFCHAPLAEQSEVTSKGKKNAGFDARLRDAGVACASCHLREGKIFGPPVGAHPLVEQGKSKGHGKSVKAGFFQKSEFCAACHQLDEGYSLNGKLLVNTYNEWKGSSFAEEGVQCQDCHMPDKEHLWRGVHDPEMTGRALDIKTVRTKTGAKLVITNAGAGHYFPTYATPLVVVTGFVKDVAGAETGKKEGFIGRKVSLDLEREEFDTRLAPGKSFEFEYAAEKPPPGAKIVFEVRVFPDMFYNGFFKLAATEGVKGINRGLASKAMAKTESSPYLLWRGEIPAE
ncbi:MAG: hypothetical protein HY098_07770 [Nitrospinae bacterium]|nr:hypothetical protein [Nitrospinota bacterium]